MFRNKDDRLSLDATPKPASDARSHGPFDPTRISQGTVVRGDINSPGAATIDGKVEGNIVAQGEVHIGPKGEVTGEVEAKSITVGGWLKGKLFSDDKVQLLSGAHVEGDIHSQSLKIDDAVFFQGGCIMGEGARQRRADSKPRSIATPPNLKAA